MLGIHPEIRAAVLDEHIEFFEAARVEETFETLPRGEFAFLVLGVYALLAATEPGGGPALYEFIDPVLLYVHIR